MYTVIREYIRYALKVHSRASLSLSFSLFFPSLFPRLRCIVYVDLSAIYIYIIYIYKYYTISSDNRISISYALRTKW